jgi:hypothetical protein
VPDLSGLLGQVCPKRQLQNSLKNVVSGLDGGVASGNLFSTKMKYELIVETEACTSFFTFPHNREGSTAAFEKLGSFITKHEFRSAKIVSNRDNVIFEFPSKN